MKIRKMLVGVLLARVIVLVSNVQVSALSLSLTAEENMTPSVPLAEALNGRANIARYLMRGVRSVVPELTGRSCVGPKGEGSQLLTESYLASKGYKFDGDFDQLGEIIEGNVLTAEIIPLRNGQYDVSLSVSFLDGFGRTNLFASSLLFVENDEGGPIARVEPYVFLVENINVIVPGTVQQALWTSGGYENFANTQPTNLPVRVNEVGETVVIIPTSRIDNGFLSLTDKDGNLTVYDLAHNAQVTWQRLLVMIGKAQSSEFKTVKASLVGPGEKVDWTFGLQFYKVDGQLYGRYPLVQIVDNPNGFRDTFQFSVPIWGTDQKALPTSVTMVDMATEARTELFSSKNGFWSIDLPPGAKSNLEARFEVIDFSSYPLNHN